MVINWYSERSRLKWMREKHPDWSKKRLGEEMRRSYSWVKKWLKRIAGAEGEEEEEEVLKGQSRCPQKKPASIEPEVVKKILTIRDDPPEGLQRTPGPEAIKYYLHRDEELKEGGYYVPTSTATIWRILDENGRIWRSQKAEYTPLNRNAPMQEWEMDFKDVTSVKFEKSDKRAHVVETLNIVDTGSSILVDNKARTDYNAETVIDSLVQTWHYNGIPQMMRFDRDPRFIGSWSGDEFPSPMMRLMLNLGIEVDVCPPRQPWKNPYVERFNRTYKYEGILIYQPHTLTETKDMNLDLKFHYNYQRPNQALTCQNQPPAVAFANLPPLPQLPDTIDPDHWLTAVHNKLYKRRVNSDGTVQLGKQRYYVQRKLAKHFVALKIDAPNRLILVLLDDQLLKSIPLKGLYDSTLPFERYIELIKAEAISDLRYSKRNSLVYSSLAA